MQRASRPGLWGYLLVAGASLSVAPAQAQLIDFKDVDPGTTINDYYADPYGITFSMVDPLVNGGQVFADNPGLPASPTRENNALVGIFGEVSVHFDPLRFMNGTTFRFSVLPDPEGFGVTSAPVLFYDAQDNLLGEAMIDLTKSGEYSSPFDGVQRVTLPGDAYYGYVAGVPEPGVLALLGAGLCAAAGWRLRRRNA